MRQHAIRYCLTGGDTYWQRLRPALTCYDSQVLKLHQIAKGTAESFYQIECARTHQGSIFDEACCEPAKQMPFQPLHHLFPNGFTTANDSLNLYALYALPSCRSHFYFMLILGQHLSFMLHPAKQINRVVAMNRFCAHQHKFRIALLQTNKLLGICVSTSRNALFHLEIGP